MTKRLLWMFAAILICGASAFTSCTDDNTDNPIEPIDNLAEKIIGKWILAEKGGEPAPTNLKAVFTFKSSTEAYFSISIGNIGKHSAIWEDGSTFDVSINGNLVTLTEKGTNEGVSAKEELFITSISDTEFTAYRTTSVFEKGEKKGEINENVRFVKVTADYSTDILGTWECEGLTGGETYNDDNARLVFLADGTYRYYRKNSAGQWEAVTTREYQKYFVDGSLLATCWKNKGEDELREWWEVASISGDQMLWTAMRHKIDGTNFQQTMKWKKIDLKVAEKIIGKWITADRNGEPISTNLKQVINFVSSTEAYCSSSMDNTTNYSAIWKHHSSFDVAISGNVLTLTEQNTGEAVKVKDELDIIAISDTELTAVSKVVLFEKDEEKFSAGKIS